MTGFVFIFKTQLYEYLTAVCVCVHMYMCVGEGYFYIVTREEMHIGLSSLYGK